VPVACQLTCVVYIFYYGDVVDVTWRTQGALCCCVVHTAAVTSPAAAAAATVRRSRHSRAQMNSYYCRSVIILTWCQSMIHQWLGLPTVSSAQPGDLFFPESGVALRDEGWG